MSSPEEDEIFDEMLEAEDLPSTLSLAYEIEQGMYGIAIVLGLISSIYTIRKFRRSCRKNLDVAARLISYKISLSVADVLILFVYAPTQLVWISTFWVLIAFDGLMTIARINKLRVKGQSDYNTRLCLCIAWLLALACSMPQLFIFKIVYHNNEDPQCTSIWYEHSQLLIKEEIERMMEMEAANETELFDELFISNSSISEKWILMQKWEKVYNIVHVSLICVIPYLLELICYALILAFLSEAEKGEFTGFRRFIRTRIVRCLPKKRRKEEQSERLNSLLTIVEEAQSDSAVHRTHPVTRKISRSANSSPTPGHRLEILHASESVSVERRRLTMPANAKRVATRLDTEMPSRFPRKHNSRRASAPCAEDKAPCAPWAKTVNVARKNARKKAFLMLSFNLLFWLPYCVHATLSSFVELDYFNFQFACALVVFNAITNILL